jgi:hypothetical protein
LSKLIILYSIVTIFNIFWVFSFFIKLVGVETKKWSTSISIFQIINLLPRTIGIFQIPLITLFTESAINSKQPLTPFFYQGIIFFNLLGVLIGTALLPFFINSLKQIISNIYETESFLNIIKKELGKLAVNFFKIKNYYSFFPKNGYFTFFDRTLFINNTLTAFLLCTAFPACVLAGYYIPNYRATIISMVSIIYGVASVINILFIETRVSLITDKTFHNQISFDDYKIVLFDCLKGRIVGTCVGIFLLPLIADMIAFAIKLVLLISA